MDLLFFTQISPFPINGGERIRSYGLLKALSELGFQVTAVIGNEDNINLKDYTINNVEYVVLKESKHSIWEKVSGSYYFKTSKDIRIIFESLIKKKKYNLVFLDYAYIGQYIRFFKKRNIPVIYGTHNAESSLMLQEPVKGVFKKIRKVQFYWLAYCHELYFFPKADRLLCVTEQDSFFYGKFIDETKIRIIPNFLDESRYTQHTLKEDYIVMTANFGAYMNKLGLQWIIEEVWNSTLDEKHRLLVVGKNSKQAYNDVSVKNKYDNIIPIGTVDDIMPYIAKAKAVVIPLQQGSGSRLKCLEAMALRTSIISTSKGVEGINANGFVIADSAEEFREAIQTFKSSKVNEKQLYESFVSNYSLHINKLRLKDLIRELIL